MPTGRVYCLEDNGRKITFPSVTTVLSKLSKPDIDAWKERVGLEEANKISQIARDKGTALHDLLEQYVRKQGIDRNLYNPMVFDDFEMVLPILDEHLGKVIAVEEILYSFRLNTAGRVDLIGEWGGVPHVIDFKTSKKEKERHEFRRLLNQSILSI